MKKIFFCLMVLASIKIQAQTIQVQLFLKGATAGQSQIGIRARATSVPVNYTGVNFYMYYQSANAAPLSTVQNTGIGIDDSKIATGFGWGTGDRNTNPAFILANTDAGAPGGPIYDRRFIYGNVDASGALTQTLINSRWDTLIYITFNNLQPAQPQGGYAYLPGTLEPGSGATFQDEFFGGIIYTTNMTDIPLTTGVVPVSLSNFDISCTGSGAQVNWKTANETNTNRFEIQKSTNGTDWNTIQTIAASGQTSAERTYTKLDAAAGDAYYRLKIIDNDGSIRYSDIKASACGKAGATVIIYPNPAKDVLNIRMDAVKAARTTLQVYDAEGKLVKAEDAVILTGTNSLHVDLRGLANGQYFIRSTNPDAALNQKFIIKN